MRSIGESPGSWRTKHDRIPLELARTIFTKVTELATSDDSPVSVARKVSCLYSMSISPGTVRHWMVGDRSPLHRTDAKNNFILKPSPALSYVIGANLGDGCTLAKGYCVKLSVTDRDFAQTFNDNLAALFTRSKANRISVMHFASSRLPIYTVRYCSKQLYNLLQLPLKELMEVASAFPRDFLRGLFDAEGHVDVGVGERFHLAVGAENSDELLLSHARLQLTSLGVESRIERKRKAGTTKVIRGKGFLMRRTSYSLMIGRIEDARRFSKIIGFSILRKQIKLEDALNVIDTVAPKERCLFWKHHYEKKNGEWVKMEFSSIVVKGPVIA